MADKKSFGFLKTDTNVDFDEFIRVKESEGLKFIGYMEDFPTDYLWIVFEVPSEN